MTSTKTVTLDFKRKHRPYHVRLHYVTYLGEEECRDYKVLAPSSEAAAIIAYKEICSTRCRGFTLKEVKTWVQHQEDD